MQMTHCPRISSFCAHGLLQRSVFVLSIESKAEYLKLWLRGDEPMVVLDSHLDWRFAKNVRINLIVPASGDSSSLLRRIAARDWPSIYQILCRCTTAHSRRLQYRKVCSPLATFALYVDFAPTA